LVLAKDNLQIGFKVALILIDRNIKSVEAGMRLNEAASPWLARIGQGDTLKLEFADATTIRLEGLETIYGDPWHPCCKKKKLPELSL
jgi:hypothetical protein